MASETQLIDETNRRIIEELQAEARLSMAELGRRVSLSPPAVAERVQRLERAGVINGYHAAVDPKAIGYPLAAVVRVRPSHGSCTGSRRSRARSPRSSSATGSPARTATSSSSTSARWTTSSRSSTASPLRPDDDLDHPFGARRPTLSPRRGGRYSPVRRG